MTEKRWYIGCVQDFCLGTYRYEAFTHKGTPEPEGRYTYVVGPFKTKRAALWAEKYGVRNPHFGCVEDAERIARETAATPYLPSIEEWEREQARDDTARLTDIDPAYEQARADQ